MWSPVFTCALLRSVHYGQRRFRKILHSLMRFTEWAEGQTHRSVAEQLDLSRSYITNMLNGSRTPSVSVIRRMRDCSDGQVSADELIDEFADA